MCEITNKNFYEKYFDILQDVTSSNFISIDCEFSGLQTHGEHKISLFDSPAERYEKLKKNINNFVAIQIGISAFVRIAQGKYRATTYTFYLFPRKYSGQKLVSSCESNSIEFLCNQKFDFNKVFYDGVTFASAANESSLRMDIEDGSLMNRLRSQLLVCERDVVRDFCTRVDAWRRKAEEGKTLVLDTTEVEPFLRYFIKMEIELRYADVRASRGRGYSLQLVKTGADGAAASGESDEDRKEELLALALGFTRLIREISSTKIPVVGHNMFTDLLMLYKMFFSPLPARYEDFKSEISRLFPHIYDTKFMSYRMKQKMKGTAFLWTSNALEQLYGFFKREKFIVVYMPQIVWTNDSDEHFHDSGFDSYCTGHIFLKLAHMESMWDESTGKFRNVSLGDSPKWYFNAVRPMENHINLMRSNSKFVNLAGSDPAGKKPILIVVESRGAFLDSTQLSDALAKFEGIDVCQSSKKTALVACPNGNMARTIFKQLKRDESYNVSNYSRKSPLSSGTIWTFLTVVGGLFFVYYVAAR